MTTLCPAPKFKAFNVGSTTPLVGGKLYTYDAGTTTPRVTYKDSTLLSLNTNPVILNSNGEADVWLDESPYKLVLKDSADASIWSVDNVVSLEAAIASLSASAIKKVATFADISAALVGMSAGQQLSLVCHTVPGYGGGIFNVVSSTALTADNGYTVINGALAAVRFDDYVNGINIENYGAKRVCPNTGDATINSNAFIAAHAKALAVGSFVYLPLIYDINRMAAFSTFLRVKGADRDKSGVRIYWDGASTFPFLASSSPYFSSTKGCRFENMSFDQRWKYKTISTGPVGYDDSQFAATWGGYWLGEFNTTDEVEFDNVRFYDTSRGFLTIGANVKATKVYSKSPESIIQCLVAGDSSVSYKVIDCEVIGPRWDVEPLWGGFPVTGNSAFFGHDMRDLVIDTLVMEGQQVVFRGDAPGGNSKRGVVTNLKLTSPPGDTAFYSIDDFTISQVDIKYSGDMGLAIAAARRCTIGNINVNGCHIGGIAVVGSEYVSVSGPMVAWNVGQNYARIKLFNRYASTAGPWLSAFVMDFKAGSTKAVENIIQNITAGFDTIPEVSDTYGLVRSKVFGIFIEPTTSAQSHTYTLSNCRMPDYRGSGLSSFMIFSTEHRFYLAPASRTGVPVVGEKFSNGANTFIYLSDFGDGSYCNVKRLVGTIAPTTVYTGATSGATLTSAILPQLEWLKVVQGLNFDWTTEGPDGR